jgi:hypothetical protein
MAGLKLLSDAHIVEALHFDHKICEASAEPAGLYLRTKIEDCRMRDRLCLIIFLVSLAGCSQYPEERVTAPLTEVRRAPVAHEAETKADAAFEPLPAGVNLTAQFRDRFQDPEHALTPEQAEALKPYRILIVHGLLGEVGLKFTGLLDKFSRGQGLIDYFKDQKRVFDELHLDYAVAGFKTASVDRSSTKIADAIAASDRPVIVLSHSKGGIDTLDALRKLDAQGKLGKVAGWISVQGVFYGSPDADEYVNSCFKRTYAKVAIKCLGGNFDSVKDLTCCACERYEAEHKDEIERIVRTVPIVCFASWTDEPKRGQLSDGQVPAKNEILCGCDYVAASHISHSETVINSKGEFDRTTFTKALLSLLADKMKNAGNPKP